MVIFDLKYLSMKNTLILLVCSVLVLTTACKEEKKADEGPSQMEQVLAVHDEVMPKMKTIGNLVGELKSKVDSTAMGQQYEVAMKDLQNAHKSMMDWMQNFGTRFDQDDIRMKKELTEQKQQWLDEEELKVKALKEEINGSIARAEALLNRTKEN